MESIAVTKPGMGVLSQERLLLSPFGALAQAFSQEILDRARKEEGRWSYVPLDLLEEGEESQTAPAVPPVIQVDLHLVLEQGVVTTVDSVSLLMAMVNQGMSIPLAGTIILRDSFGTPQREWTIVGAHLQKYVGPQLNSNQASVAVSRIELIHNGCF